MDTVQWREQEILYLLKARLNFESAVFSSSDTLGETLERYLLDECATKRPHQFSVDGELFLKLFKISDNNIDILRYIRREVKNFEFLKENFLEKQKTTLSL